MKISLCGAAGEVTGSGYLVDTGKARVLIDFGMFQGHDATQERNRSLGPVDASRLDAVVLTHAHIDHSGRLPLLVRGGFKGKIFATPATIDVTDLLLRDSGHIQESDALRETRRNQRRGRPAVEPLYTLADVEATLPLLTPLEYDATREVTQGVTARLVDAGHILGSASVELKVRDGAAERTIVFSGDIGPKNMPLLRDPVRLASADLVFLESTYGDRDHRPIDQTITEFRDALVQTAWAKQKVLIPAFAVGRTQQLMYFIAELRESGQLPDIPVYLDSPMAIKATALYRAHSGLLDHQALASRARPKFLQSLERIRSLATAAESRSLNDTWDPCVIIAASGMCEGGRIVHHLKHNLWKHGVTVLITGYQAQGTLGRRLVEGAREVRIFGDDILVRAKIATLGGLSGHAGQTELLEWYAELAGSRPRTILTHGEDRGRVPLAAKIKERHGVACELPGPGSSIDFS